jgi:hypothetical protein
MIGSSSQISTVLNKITTLLYFGYADACLMALSAQTVPFPVGFGFDFMENIFALLASRANYNSIWFY